MILYGVLSLEPFLIISCSNYFILLLLVIELVSHLSSS